LEEFHAPARFHQSDCWLGGCLAAYFLMVYLREAVMRPHRATAFFVALAMLLVHAASAQVTDRMKATAPEKMMSVDKAPKMRECQKRAEQQKIKMENRSRFVDECVAAKAKK
jgi:hypothetical protein